MAPRHFAIGGSQSTHESIDYHFRKGEIDEWRTAFGPQVIRESAPFPASGMSVSTGRSEAGLAEPGRSAP